MPINKSDKKFVRPPEKFSKQQIEAWVKEEAQTIGLDLPIDLVETEEWADYVNHHHFVPNSVEDIPEGYEFDYNWAKDENPRRGLPCAEVIETGQFRLWWDRCNYYEMPEDKCRQFIKGAVRHEYGHYIQWQKIAITVLSAIGYNVDSKKLPAILTDVEAFAGAKEAFMRIWADPAHYQCREVEVYTTQIENGEMAKDTMSESDWVRRLSAVYVYAHGNKNSPGCENSKWALEFSAFIKKADELFKANNIQPQKPVK